MPLGNGYFYDRKKKRYITISEHATDALASPEVFDCHEITHLNPVKDRDDIIVFVLKKGFIRVRHWKDRLGWQFFGDLEGALKVLNKYMKDKEVGDACIVTFTDFQTFKSLTCNAGAIKKENFLTTFLELV
jgi:hypothetical protein